MATNALFDLLPINWQAIASILTLAVATAASINILRDRVVLKVFADVETVSDSHVLTITITCRGKRPVTPVKWWAIIKRDDHSKCEVPGETKCMPKLLHEGEYLTECTDQFKDTLLSVQSIHVVDTTGKIWKCRIQRRKWRRVFKYTATGGTRMGGTAHAQFDPHDSQRE